MHLLPRDPRTGEISAPIPATTREELFGIQTRLRQAQAAFAAAPIATRAEQLLRLQKAIAANRQAIQAALELDTGRRAIARQEIDGVIGAISGWTSQAATLLDSTWVGARSNPKLRHRAHFHPYALVGVISPWNFPLTLSFIDTIPALLAGCAVIIKPSEVTPRFAAPLRRAIADAELSDVLAIVDGDGGVGADLIGAVDAVCFTGSVATGRKVASACADRLIPAFLELGGKDPLIVLPSANLDAAVTAALRGSVLATGQACQSIERIYVHRSIHDVFVERLTHAARACRFNWPDITIGDIGPIIFDRQADVLRAHLDDARAKGARIHSGGAIETHGGGLWLAPTVLSNVNHDMQVMREETFGPIMPVMPFATVDEAVALANDTQFGLSAAVFAGTIEEAEAVAMRLEAGAVSLNDAALTALFYEAEKHSFRASGLGGSRMGKAGFQRFLRRQALIANDGAPIALSAFAEDA
jgi:acyl-CoA reductase-like NAD-dependent aldehyde dehydrogenase